MTLDSSVFPLRPAWIEIDLARLRRNLQLIRRDLPPHVQLLAVVKDEAYGHGAIDVARVALEEGATFLGVSTLEEAMHLRDAGITAPLLLLGERVSDQRVDEERQRRLGSGEGVGVHCRTAEAGHDQGCRLAHGAGNAEQLRCPSCSVADCAYAGPVGK